MKTNLGWHVIALNPTTQAPEDAQVLNHVQWFKDKSKIVVRFSDGTTAGVSTRDVLFLPDLSFASDD